ncbi:hypothetical protein APHAL10511_006159 [Amanita phalloides]|nr:hypothetical protein APHAL10511_006159 [Amanita phalloides]
MRLPRRVPWASWTELEQLCAWIYADSASPDSRLRAIHRLSAWRAIAFLPHALDSALSLLIVLSHDKPENHPLFIRHAYAAAIIRFVNGFVDPLQYGAYARPIASIAHQLGLPHWLVELRHASTHDELPSLELLRDAANESMTWLLHNYFLPTLNPSSARSQRNPLQSLAPLLKQYKTLLKLTTRDASLASQNKLTIAALIRDIERWISEAKVAANLTAGDLGWKVGKAVDDADTNNQDRERWALEKLCDELLEKGAVIPLSKKKRICPADTFSPPILSVQIWSPLLYHLQGFHPDLPIVFCSNMISYLTSSDDSTFKACLARWIMWSVKTWGPGEKDDDELKREVVTLLMQALGHGLSDGERPMREAHDLLLRLCDGKPEWQGPLTLLLHPLGRFSETEWVSQNIDVMDDRLDTIRSINAPEKDTGSIEKDLDPMPSVILKSFVDGANNGLDGVIPRHVLERARGFAIFTVFKAGFLLSARAGSGIVIARLDDGSWSAPSAIGLGGVGVGGQAGAEMTDFLVVLNSRSAVRSFMAAGSLSLGGNLSIALGPLGRNGEASGSVNTSGKVAAMYSYSKTRGLFGGISLEGSVIVERQDANHRAYESPVTVKLLLGGMVDPPPWSASLINTLDSCTGIPRYNKWVDDAPRPFTDEDYAFASSESHVPTPDTPKSRSYLKKKRPEQNTFPPTSWGRRTDTGAYFYDDTPDQDLAHESSRFETTFGTDYTSEYGLSEPPLRQGGSQHNCSFSAASPFVTVPSHTRSSTLPTSSNPFFTPEDHSVELFYTEQSLNPPASRSEARNWSIPDEGMPRAIALYNFRAVEPGDLAFLKGEVITITQKSDKTDDWWTGKIGERTGIFPANFVDVV